MSNINQDGFSTIRYEKTSSSAIFQSMEFQNILSLLCSDAIENKELAILTAQSVFNFDSYDLVHQIKKESNDIRALGFSEFVNVAELLQSNYSCFKIDAQLITPFKRYCTIILKHRELQDKRIVIPVSQLTYYSLLALSEEPTEDFYKSILTTYKWNI